MSKLRALVEELDGDELVDALVAFDYKRDPDADVEASFEDGEWYEAVADRPLGGADTVDELMELVILGKIDVDTYSSVMERLQAEATDTIVE